MKQIKLFGLIAISIAVLFFGCTKWFVDSKTGEHYIPPEITEYGVNTLGFALGIAVAQQPAWVDTSLTNVYLLAVQGTLDVPALNQLLDTFYQSNDLAMNALANRVLNLAKAFGGVVKDKQILHIDELDPVLMKAMANGYVEGRDLVKMQANTKGG